MTIWLDPEKCAHACVAQVGLVPLWDIWSLLKTVNYRKWYAESVERDSWNIFAMGAYVILGGCVDPVGSYWDLVREQSSYCTTRVLRSLNTKIGQLVMTRKGHHFHPNRGLISIWSSWCLISYLMTNIIIKRSLHSPSPSHGVISSWSGIVCSFSIGLWTPF